MDICKECAFCTVKGPEPKDHFCTATEETKRTNPVTGEVVWPDCHNIRMTSKAPECSMFRPILDAPPKPEGPPNRLVKDGAVCGKKCDDCSCEKGDPDPELELEISEKTMVAIGNAIEGSKKND